MSMFMRRGKSATLIAATLADPDNPTLPEIAAAEEISAAVIALEGFETTVNRINQPVQKYAQELQIGGPQQFQDVSILLAEDDGVGSDADSVERQAAKTALVEGATVYAILSPRSATVAAATKVHVWPVKVDAVNPSFALDAEAARYRAVLSVQSPPSKEVAVVAGP